MWKKSLFKKIPKFLSLVFNSRGRETPALVIFFWAAHLNFVKDLTLSALIRSGIPTKFLHLHAFISSFIICSCPIMRRSYLEKETNVCDWISTVLLPPLTALKYYHGEELPLQDQYYTDELLNYRATPLQIRQLRVSEGSFCDLRCQSIVQDFRGTGPFWWLCCYSIHSSLNANWKTMKNTCLFSMFFVFFCIEKEHNHKLHDLDIFNLPIKFQKGVLCHLTPTYKTGH